MLFRMVTSFSWMVRNWGHSPVGQGPPFRLGCLAPACSHWPHVHPPSVPCHSSSLVSLPHSSPGDLSRLSPPTTPADTSQRLLDTETLEQFTQDLTLLDLISRLAESNPSSPFLYQHLAFCILSIPKAYQVYLRSESCIFFKLSPKASSSPELPQTSLCGPKHSSPPSPLS